MKIKDCFEKGLLKKILPSAKKEDAYMALNSAKEFINKIKQILK